MTQQAPHGQTPAGGSTETSAQGTTQAVQGRHQGEPSLAPGRPARWETAAKSGVGTALGTASPVWFTLAREAGVDGYYARLARPDQMAAPEQAHGTVTLPNHPPGRETHPAADIVSPDVLTLVRYGLRAADDPRIVNTVRVIDRCCKVETPRGPAWHRYTDDGYGEHADGSPFDGMGVGRAWPLLTGERAHYELAAGRTDEARGLQHALERLAGDSGLLPEQVWDTDPIPDQGLFPGRPTGSAMPLVWAHAEYIKLRRSLHDGHVFDRPPQSARRYLRDRTRARHALWRMDQPRRALPAGKVLRLEVLRPARVRWTRDAWASHDDLDARDAGLGVFVADLPTEDLREGAVQFTFHWTDEGRWEGRNFRVVVESTRTPDAAGGDGDEKSPRGRRPEKAAV